MNRERPRGRAERSSNPVADPTPSDNGIEGPDGVGEILLPDGDAELLIGGNEMAAVNGNGHSSNDSDGSNGHGSNGHANGNGVQRPAIILPRRKRRVSDVVPAQEVAIAPDETVVIAPTSTADVPTMPMSPVVSPPAPARPNLPARATRRTHPARVAPAAVVEAPAETDAVVVPVTGWRTSFTLGNVLWFSFLVLTLITRFWDLSNRGIHHDESLHATYSNYLYIGNGYTHDPMMHGPLQFHLIAFMYWLFGPNEATARFASAFCGVWVVMSPFFLRRQMGKVPALLATFLLFISPSILYFSRMAREDSIFSAMEMLMIVGLWRFLSTRRPADFYIFCAGLALMFTIKETAFLTVAVLGLLFIGLFVVQSGYAIMAALGAYAVAMGGWLVYVNGGMKNGTIGPLPNIPDTSPNYDKIAAFVQSLLTHPLVVGAAIFTLLFVIAVAVLFRMQKGRMAQIPAANAVAVRTRSRIAPGRVASDGVIARRAVHSNGNGAVAAAETTEIAPTSAAVTDISVREEYDPDAASELWDPRRIDPRPGTLLAHYQPGSIPHLIGALFSRPSVLLIGFVIAATIFTTFYTVFFTDVPRGIASGLFASLGYWMAQQGVARGGQPWYYYLLILPLYEPIAVFFSLAGTIFFGWKGVRWLVRRKAENRYVETPTHLGAFNVDRPVPFASFSALMPLFLITWIFGALFLYSWAGEKMPWLMVHMVRPASLLSALFIGMLLTSLVTRRRERLVADGVAATNLSTPILGEERPVPANGSRVPVANGTRNRRTATARVASASLVRKQEAPWVSWNRPGSRFPALSFVGLFVIFAFCYGMALNTLMDKAKTPEGYSNWGLSWFWPALMAALVVAYAVWLGPGRALRYFGIGIFSVFLLYEVRSAVMLSYFQPDVPKEMAVYVQTSPDVTRTMKELNDFSTATTGGKNAKVLYDSFASWPFSWYLRDYKNAQFIGADTPKPGPDVSVMLTEYAKTNPDQLNTLLGTARTALTTAQSSGDAGAIAAAQANVDNLNNLINNYTAQRYAMRWWFPEEWYKNDLMSGLPTGETYINAPISTSASVLAIKLGDTFTKPDNQATLWNYLMFREPAKPLGSEDMIVFVRKDVAQLYHFLQYGPMPGDDLPLAYQDLPVPTENQRPTPDNNLH